MSRVTNRLRSNCSFSLVVLAILILSFSASVNAAEEAKDIYKTYCWQCHGMSGNGNGLNIRDMSVQPRDHTDGKSMSARSDDDLIKAIKEGGQSINKSVLMPPWDGVLTDEEINSLVVYLRELCQCQYGKAM
ncbi:MAG: c-type cytochrome [Gammaproteobacteria bacterium]